MLNDLLATIDNKIDEIWDELLFRLDGTPTDTGAMFELYLKVLEIKEELGRSMSQYVLSARAVEFIEDLLEVFEQVSCSLEDVLKRNEPLTSRITNSIYACLYVHSHQRALRIEDISKRSAGLIMRLRVEIMEYLQALDLRLLRRLEQNPEEERSLREVSEHIKLLLGALDSLKLILGSESVLGPQIKYLKILFRYLYESYRIFIEQRAIPPQGMIQVSYLILHLLRKIMGFPETKEEPVCQSIGDLIDKIATLQSTISGELPLCLEKKEQFLLNSELVQLELDIETSVEESIPSEVEVGAPRPLVEVRVSGLDEPVIAEHPADADSNKGFALLIELLSELMMSRSVFKSLSHQALFRYNLPKFSKEINAIGSRFLQMMENFEDTILGLSCFYTKSGFHKQRVLPFESSGQALFLDLNQVLEVLKLPKKSLFQRWGQSFCNYRGETIGLVFLSELFGQSTVQMTDLITIIVISARAVKVGVVVEKISIEQVVLVKPLPELLVGQREIKGAAIMEDGRISLMLDGSALIQRVLEAEKEQED